LDKILQATKIINDASNIVVITGAGASTESGIPDFRSDNGPAKKKKYDYPVEVLLSHSFFMNKTETFYDYYLNNMIFRDAKPNDCHKSLAEMEKYCNTLAIITQNIDGLHQEAGSSNVIELHGTTKRNYCMKCKKEFSIDYIFKINKPVPACDKCGGIIKPDVVLYEEPLNEKDLSKAISIARKADVLLVIGTSLLVYPAAGLLNYYRGDKLIILNMGATPFDSMAEIVIRQRAGDVMKKIVNGLKS
jgi:NAD-dependent deacetylase